MSTELRVVPNTEISQTRFAGGRERGSCIQLTAGVDQFIQLDRTQALAVAQELLLFANRREVIDLLADYIDVKEVALNRV